MMRYAVIVIILTSMLHQSGTYRLDPNLKCDMGRNCAGTDYPSTIEVCPAVISHKSKITIKMSLYPMLAGKVYTPDPGLSDQQYTITGPSANVKMNFTSFPCTVLSGEVKSPGLELSGQHCVRTSLGKRFEITDVKLKIFLMMYGQIVAEKTFFISCEHLLQSKSMKSTRMCPFPANEKTEIQKTLDRFIVDILKGYRGKISMILKLEDSRGRPFLCSNVTLTFDNASV